MRRKGGEVLVTGTEAATTRTATKIEKGAFKNDSSAGMILKHDPHGDSSIFNRHLQTENKAGHTFYAGLGGLGILLAPNIVEASSNPCTTNGQFASAIAWDTAGLIDPVGITDGIDAYTGLDGGRGGVGGVLDLLADLSLFIDPTTLMVPYDR